MKRMEWAEIQDPKGIFIFDGNAWKEVSGEFFPEEIQDLINKKSVLGMVKEVNNHFQAVVKIGRPLRLSNTDGEAKVVSRYEHTKSS